MITNKSVSFSKESLDYIQEKAKNNQTNFSVSLGLIIQQHRKLNKEIEKQENLKQLRNSALQLWKEHEIPQEAIISWVRDVTGGFK